MQAAAETRKRRRPILKAFLALVGVAVVGLLVLGVLIASRMNAKPGPLVDYYAIVNAEALAVPEEERAWPLYEAAINRYMTLDEETRTLLTKVYPGSELWDQARLELHRHATLAEDIITAAGRPALGYAVYPGQSAGASSELMLMMESPLDALRDAMRLMASHARERAESGDADSVVEAIRALLSIANHAAQPPSTIAQLVRIAGSALATDVTREIVASHPDLLSVAQASELALAFTTRRSERFTIDFAIERMSFLDVAQRIYTDDGAGDGHLSPAGLASLGNVPQARMVDGGFIGAAGSLISRSRAQMLSWHDTIYDDAQAYAETPLWQRGEGGFEATSPEYVRLYRVFPDPGVILLGALVGPIERLTEAGDVINMRLDATILVLAAHRHRLATGDWPASIAEIDESLLPTTPVDRFDGQPLRYRVTDDGPLIYSVGGDRDDDGGRHSKGALRWVPPDHIEAQHKVQDDFDGDVVFFPPPKDVDD